jgi:uncharacterized protein
MIDEQLLATLVCPTDRSPLSLADDTLLGRLNRAIAVGGVKNRAGHEVAQPVAGALVRGDQTLLYPILDGIPLLVPDEAILLADL